MANKGSILMERYELGRLLGQGTFAKVYYARNIRNGQSVAIKVIDKEKVLRVGLVNQIKREISVMRLVRHPNIVHLYEVMATKTKIYFVMEYAKGGELFNQVAKGRLKEDVARKYFQQLINAVDFCHSRGVYHRDLKPENLLLDDDENLKISDFGLSAFVEPKRQDGLLHTMCGTPAYVAPEVINRKGYDGAKADIWSCGVVLFVLLAGYLPFQDSNLMEMYRKIGKAEFRCPSWFPPEARRLLSKMLDPNPSTRISLAKIRGSTWFRRGISISSKSTVVDEVSTDLASANTEEKQEVARIPNLNAFDIISLYAKFDLSKLFEEPCLKKEAKFTSWKPASVIISKLEDTAKRLKLKVSKRDAGLLRFEGIKEGRKGILAIDAEIFEVIEAFHLVEVKKSDGDTLEYQEILNEGLRPGLQDIVWTWQEEKQPQQSEDQLDEQPNDQLQQQQLQPQQHLIQQEQLP
ncbi:CBL-interacting protein kinase 2-like [Nicotiana tomentosiformis]|uniref:CBL-interacting protein kinase 2-like n=1 Tax=Nicotiana tomentosiformis TaxID=4098 RepID=UPI00051BF25E|nr:CBL-interacting protein kinase 2-like [Nicotiana tomentosiformis]XP_009629517.1 CBL-interacting protein kinase 2-like [Nicotiana tomentosiformis]